jgi:methylenetetrahydrofolate dehydrogenase (NADP+) / methenyltetrahydrofolate cyclohydrolase
MKINGKQIANKILGELKIKVKKLREKNITPHLAIILIGNDPSSKAYAYQKQITAKKTGIKTSLYQYPISVSSKEILNRLNDLNHLSTTHGIIIQRPLPSQINLKNIAQTIDHTKDVDGFHPKSKFEMPIALAVLEILRKIYLLKKRAGGAGGRVPDSAHLSEDEGALAGRKPATGPALIKWLKSKKIVVIGKGETGGSPIIQVFGKMKIPYVAIDSKTKNPENLTKKADIVISAVGKTNIVKPQMLKKGAILIGIGISSGESAKLTGDYDQNEVKNIASFYTPTPGGVGPVNVAMLFKNLVYAASGKDTLAFQSDT